MLIWSLDTDAKLNQHYRKLLVLGTKAKAAVPCRLLRLDGGLQVQSNKAQQA